MKVGTLVLAASILPLVLFHSSARAQTTSDVNAGVQFDFSLPGARSLAMGGAFVALANDATAAQANPAGLTQLYVKKPQLSIEGRGWNFFSLTPDRGHAFGTPTGIGADAVLFAGRYPRAGAELAGVEGLELNDSTRSVSLITFLYARPEHKWVIAGYRHQLMNLVNRIESSGPFVSLPSGDVSRMAPLTGRIEVDIATYGASVARSFRRLSLGGGIGYSTFSINSRAQSFVTRPGGIVAPDDRVHRTDVGEEFGAADFTEGSVAFIDEQTGEDTAWSYNAGASVRLGKMYLGGSFRRGPLFHYTTAFFAGPALDSRSLAERQLDSHDDVRFKVPDSYAAGVALIPIDTVKLNFEYTFVQYRQLIDGSGTGTPLETAGQSRSADPVVRADGVRQVEALTIDNTHQLRGGAEWAFFQRGPVPEDGSFKHVAFLRAGAWYDPDHRLRSTLTEPVTERILKQAVLLPKGKDEAHFSFGGGVLIGGRVQIDAGVDLSPRVNTIAVSSVVYF